MLRNEITNSNTFEATVSSEQQITENHHKSISLLLTSSDNMTVPTLYWLPKLHKKPFKFRFISASSKCSTTTLSKKLTTALSTIKDFIINYCNKCCERNGVNYFWSVKNSFEVLDKLNNIQDSFASVDSYDFSTLYTTLPHHLIKDKLSYLIKWSFDKCGSQFICCNSFHAFFCDNKHDKYTNWTYEDLTNALKFLLDNIYVRFGNIVYKQVIGIPMGTNCAPLIADLFLYWYESQFMAKIYKNPTEHDLVDKFNNTYRYLDDILALNNTDFGNYIKDIYPKELKLVKSNSDSCHTPFLDLDITIENGSLITKIYDKRDDFDFPIVNFPFLDGDIPLAPSYGIYISQLVRFCRICTKVSDFNERNLHLTEKLLKQGYRYHKLLKTFTKFFHRYNVLVHKFGATCRSLIRNGISHPRFYGNIVYKSYKFKNRILDMSDSLNKFIHKGYKYEIIINTLKLVFTKKDIKLLIPLLNKN